MRSLATLAGLTVAAVGVISLASAPVAPVVGAAITAAMFMVHKVSSKLDRSACRGCGASLDGVQVGAYGAACPKCGALNQQVLGEHSTRA